MKIKIINPCILFSIFLISFSAGAVDFLGDLSQAIGDVRKSTGDIAKSIKDVSKDTPASPLSSSATTEVPKEYQGKWVTNQSNCVGNPDSGVIDIEKNRFYGYEWSSYIKSTELLGNKLEVVFTTSSDGVESPEASKQSWELNNAGNTLSIFDAAGGVEKYSRCGGVSVSSGVVAPITSASVGKILFSCKAKKGKEIRLMNTGKGIEYTFGLVNQKPDILISVPYDKAFYASLGGAQSTNIQISIPNGKTYYVVYSFDYARGCGKCKSDFGHGVVVSQSGKKIADVQCDNNAKPGIDSNHRMYDMEDNLYDASDLLNIVTEEDSNFKSRGFFVVEKY
jgi:hypothetical protein